MSIKNVIPKENNLVGGNRGSHIITTNQDNCIFINNTQCQELSHTEISANQSTSKISYISQEYVYFRELVKMEKT